MKTIFFALLTTILLQGCVIAPYDPYYRHDTARHHGDEKPTLASATARGAQFGPAASEVLGSAMDINGCGSQGTPQNIKDPTVATSADIRDRNGKITYRLGASASKVHKCQ